MALHDLAKLEALNDIGEDGSSFDRDLVGAEKACGDFVKRVATNIIDKDLVDTGKILDMTVQKVDSNTIDIIGVSYIKVIDEGIRGAEDESKAPNSPYKMTKMPPSNVFADWIRSKNIKLVNNPKYGGEQTSIVEDKDIDRVAYAMALERFRKGYEPQDIFDKEIDQLVEDASDGVSEVVINKMFSGLDDLDN